MINLQNRIVEDAFYNSYLVITKKTTFDILMEGWNDGSIGTALLAHDPDTGPRKDQLINMILKKSFMMILVIKGSLTFMQK